MSLKIKRRTFIAALIYLFIGIILAVRNMDAFLMYVTILPIQLALLCWAIKRAQFVMIAFALLFFLTQGLDSFLFYYFKDEYSEKGYNAIGSFRFLSGEYFSYYWLILIFILGFVFFFRGVVGARKDGTISFLKEILSQSQNRMNNTGENNTYLIAVICCIATVLSIWMFSNQIGIRGMNQTVLPFHLTGILYYFREFVISGVIVILYLQCKKKDIACVFILAYMFFSGFASVSRGLLAFILLPIMIESLISGNKIRAALIVLFYAILFGLISQSRNIVYGCSTINAQVYFQVIANTIEMYIENWCGLTNEVIAFINSFCSRLYGCQCVVLGGQQSGVTISQMLSYWAGESFSSIFPNSALTIFGIVLPENMSFGVALGASGQIMALANHSFYRMVLQAMIGGIVFGVQERALRKTFLADTGFLIKILVLAVASGSILAFWLGLSMRIVYLATLILLIISQCKSKNRRCAMVS